MPKYRPPTGFYRSAPPAFKELKFALHQDFDIEVKQPGDFIPYLVRWIPLKDRPVVKAFLDEMFRRQLPQTEFNALWAALESDVYFMSDTTEMTRQLRDAL